MIDVNLVKEDENDGFARRHQDSMVKARICEELKFLASVRKEDRLLIIGLESLALRPKELVAIKKWLREVVEATMDMILPGSSGGIRFVSPLKTPEMVSQFVR